MNDFLVVLISIYSKLLLFYPRSFRNEFGEEMQIVFKDAMDEAVKDGYLALALVCQPVYCGNSGTSLRERKQT